AQWVKIDDCKYKWTMTSSNSQVEQTTQNLAATLGTGVGEVIDFNAMDPRNIEFLDKVEPVGDANCQFYGRNSESCALYGSYTNVTKTMVRYESKMLITSSVQLDSARVQRGWGLIYSQYCHGITKPF